MDNLTCMSCGKVFENAKQLRGHLMYEKKSLKQKQNSVASNPMVEKVKIDFKKYKELPPPIVEHLEKMWGNWLNYFEISQEFKQDFGGYALRIKVPAQFSTETETVQYPVYDNATRKQVGTKTGIVEDIRWKTLKDLPDAIKWIDAVKKNIIEKAFQKGIQLPNTNVKYEPAVKTVQDYERELAGIN